MAVQGLRLCPSNAGVQYLVEALRSHVPHSVAKGETGNPSGKEIKKRERQYSVSQRDRPPRVSEVMETSREAGGAGQRLQGALPGLPEMMMKKKKMDIRCTKGG